MRFLLKSAFWLGLLAFLLPGGTPSGGETEEVSIFSAMIGAQAAFQDLAGFCERSPSACETGRDLAAFAGARISDGMVLAYGLAGSSLASGEVPAEGAAPALALAVEKTAPALGATDPVQTGSLAQPRMDAASRAVPAEDIPGAAPAAAFVAIPLPQPAPRA